MHQSTTPPLSQTIWPRWASTQFLSLPIVQILLPVTFGYFLSPEAVIMRQLRRWKRLWRRSLTRSHKRTSMGRSRSCWYCTTSAFQPEEITSNQLLSIKVPIRKKSAKLFNGPRSVMHTHTHTHTHTHKDLLQRQNISTRVRKYNYYIWFSFYARTYIIFSYKKDLCKFLFFFLMK